MGRAIRQIDRAIPLARTRRQQPEEAGQIALIDWRDRIGRTAHPELDLLHAIPMGGKRSAREAARLKKAGARAGVSDLFLPVARGGYHGLYIEMKAGRNKCTPEQTAWQLGVIMQGYYAVTCWGWEQAKDVLLDYMKSDAWRGQKL